MGSYNLTTLVTFTGTNGATPVGSLIADTAGNLYGTTAQGGNGDGTVFEVPRDLNTRTGYGTVLTLGTFDTTAGTGISPTGNLFADAAGNLIGTTVAGGPGRSQSGTVFEIPKDASSPTGYGFVTNLVAFGTAPATGAYPHGSLVADTAGNLYGTTAAGGANRVGTIFEIPKNTSVTGYGSAATLVSFDSSGGFSPVGSLTLDSLGNLYGTTSLGFSSGGTVFRLPKIPGGGYGTISTLATFASGSAPLGSLVADAAGNLYGTTASGGTGGHDTVFEVPVDVTTSTGYGAVLTLIDFAATSSGAQPHGSLTLDSAGNLYGTTSAGGAFGGGTAFEVPKITGTAGYGSVTTLFNFASDGAPYGDLLPDGAGNFFGTTSGIGSTPIVGGTVFKLSPAPVVAGSGGSGGGTTISTTPTPGPDNVTGTSGSDTIAGLQGDDTINGGGGNDVLLGNQGNDQITDGDGNSTIAGGMDSDRITVGNGANLLYGNEGSDTISAGNGGNTILGGSGNSAIDSLDGADLITSGSGNDLILGNGGDDTVAAGGGADTVLGGFGRDILLGNQGNDLLLGNQGDDTLLGGQGGDTVVGGMGNDLLYGNEGDDVLYGNEGLNTFVFAPGDTDFKSGLSTGDTVMDFKTGADKLDFASGPVGSAANFGATSTTSTDFGSIQALAQTLINGGDTYAFVADGADGFLFTTGGSGSAITDAVKLVGAGTATSFKYGDIAHGTMA